MIRRRVVLIGVAVAAGLCLMVAPPSKAASTSKPKSFSWTFQGTCCITSREWTATVKAPITIAAVLEPCHADLGDVQFTVSLWRNGKFVSARQLTCWGSPKWKKQPPGVYRFSLMILPPCKDSETFQGYGTVYYDGAPK